MKFFILAVMMGLLSCKKQETKKYYNDNEITAEVKCGADTIVYLVTGNNNVSTLFFNSFSYSFKSKETGDKIRFIISVPRIIPVAVTVTYFINDKRVYTQQGSCNASLPFISEYSVE